MNRTLALLLCLIALIGGWVAYSGFSNPHAAAGSPGSLAPKIEGSRVYFVPIGSFSSDDLTALAQCYRDNYNLDITILKSIPVDDAVRDSSRGQLMAEKLVESVRAGEPDYANDARAILIGFTSEDIYPTSQNWQFAFGWRLGSSHAAVVSTARMSLHYIGQPRDLNLSQTRLRKMVTKDIGILHYGRPQNQNPKSVLYNGIMGIEELDQVGEDF
jgi:predicted Zn-dependent protease